MIEAKALLRWVPRSEGGRLAIPPGPRYVAVARFEAERSRWPDEAWSLVCEYLEAPDYGRDHAVRVRFLADGPERLLSVGSRFELMEGQRRVADGVVVGESPEGHG